MKIISNIINMRCTVFTDKVIPFNAENRNFIMSLFQNKQLTPIVLQEIQNVVIPNNMYQSWGLIDNNLDFLQIRGNKIDVFSNTDFRSENDFCLYFSAFLQKLIEKLKLNIRRLAFAPIYTVNEQYIPDFIAHNFTVTKFGTSATQGFSFSRVFYRSETIDKYSYEMNYNTNISIQAMNPFPINTKQHIVIEQDINTKDRGREFFSYDEIKTFYENVSNLNKSYLSLFIGE